MNNKHLRGTLALLVCAFIWGSTFVAQSSAAENTPPFTFLAARSFVGALALLAISLITKPKNPKSATCGKTSRKRLLTVGAVCGTALAVASACQQYGITLGTGAGKAGFLTALYLIFVPILNYLIFRKKPGVFPIIGAVLALLGLILLCDLGNSSAFCIADMVTAGCGLCFAIHILIIDRYAFDLDSIRLSCIQFFVCGCISLLLALIFEQPTLDSVIRSALPILYAGIFSSAIAYTLQIYGQKNCPPAAATVLMSLESVFALLCEAALALFFQKPFPINRAESIGCLLMFAGVLLAQNPTRSRSK